MEARSLAFIIQSCAGELRQGAPEIQVTGVCTDSRAAGVGDVFVALKGDLFDGHNFLTEVALKGVAAVVINRSRVPAELPACAVIVVEDTRRALGQLGARYREQFSLPKIAVGGSNGKTTTKELIAAVLRQQFKTLWSQASFNNDVGVPATLLRLEAIHQTAVFEVGTNHPGELKPLLDLIRPDYGVITSIGREHLEFFGNLNGVVAEEGVLGESLSPTGKLFLGGDSEWADQLAQRSVAPVVRVGLSPNCEWRARNVCLTASGTTFEVSGPNALFDGAYAVKLLGRHQVVNALLALALGAELGLSPEQVRAGLLECEPAKMRMQPWTWNGVRILDDAYNANADSMQAALETIRELQCEGRKIAVLGDMAELGQYAPEAHEEVGRRAAASGLAQLFAVGKMSGVMAGAARGAGMSAVAEFADVSSAAAAVKGFVRSGDVMLLKASRSTRLERLSEALRS